MHRCSINISILINIVQHSFNCYALQYSTLLKMADESSAQNKGDDKACGKQEPEKILSALNALQNWLQ